MKKDLVINVLAISLPVLILQLSILPLLRTLVDAEEYGHIITIMAIINFIPGVLGNSLCNISQLEFIKKEKIDMFTINVILIFSNLICVLMVYLVSAYLNLYVGLGLLFLSVLVFYYQYRQFIFRVTKQFYNILYLNIILVSGMILGCFFVKAGTDWIILLIFGYLFACVYFLRFDELDLKKYFIIDNRKIDVRICKEYVYFAFSLFIAGIMVYADRIILITYVGAIAVTTYYIASLIGKLIVMAISPISTVLLSYLRSDTQSDLLWVKRSLLVSCGLGVVFFLIVCAVAPFILEILYPQDVQDAVQYVPILTLVAIFQSVASIVNPMVLKYFSTLVQLKINALIAVSFLALGYALSIEGALSGFCYAALIASFLKLFILVSILYKRFGKLF